jgi:choice-of-anchor B domain-containing protein
VKSLSLHALGLVALAAPLLALHDDDPKALYRRAPYAGAGWLRSSGAAPVYQPPGSAGMPMVGSGLQLLSWLSLSDLGVSAGLLANDCWGYVSPTGREYAILGTEESTLFIEVTDPFNPSLVGGIPGPVGIWRDIKVYDEYAYSVCESGCAGIQVIDLHGIDSGVITLVNTINGAGTGSSHNVVIDTDSGFLYRSGGGGLGLRFYDLSDPANPTFVGEWNDRYVHDAQVVTYTGAGPWSGRQIAFCGSGFNSGWVSPGVTIVDVTDKQNPVLLSEIQYPGAVYSHQGWLTEDRQHFLLGDELDEGTLGVTSLTHVIDVSDLANPVMAGTFTNGMNSVTHNGYVLGDRFFQANYTSGVRVFDISDPVNAVEVGSFDTYPPDDAVSYNGCWSVYPYMPSGVMVASDRQHGLYVLWAGDDLVGQPYCSPNAVNSTGLPGRLWATGSDSAAANSLELSALLLPPNQFGVFLTSQTQDFTLNPGGSFGTLCLGAPIGRFSSQIQNSGAAGAFSITVDLTAMPLTPTVGVAPGESWSFQAWYRDNNPTPTSNFTDASTVTFQ